MKRQIIKYSLLAITIAVLIALIFICVIIILNQKAQIEDQQTQASDTENEISLSTNTYFSSSTYNYLAIGNSITIHAKTEHWWNEIGMSASSAEKDYYHIITNYLQQSYGEVSSYAFNFFTWEVQSWDRAETLSLLKPYLSQDLDLITIQLSENMSDITTFNTDYIELIKYVKQQCPKAKIILVDEFWSDERSALKQAVANELDIPFASLAEIRGNEEYYCGMGTVVYDDKGDPHIVDHEGIAEHPGDDGMAYIANSIIKLLH